MNFYINKFAARMGGGCGIDRMPCQPIFYIIQPCLKKSFLGVPSIYLCVRSDTYQTSFASLVLQGVVYDSSSVTAEANGHVLCYYSKNGKTF